MSKEYLVLLVDAGEDDHSVDGKKAEIFMRFTEEPSEEFLQRVAKLNVGKRVYSLMGASTWYYDRPPPTPEHRCVAGRVGDDVYVCDTCGKDMST